MDVPYRRLEDVSCRRFKDVPVWSDMLLHGTCHTDFLGTSLRDVPRTSLRRPYMVQVIMAFAFGLSISECYITKMVSAA